jgi:hypothetical protein
MGGRFRIVSRVSNSIVVEDTEQQVRHKVVLETDKDHTNSSSWDDDQWALFLYPHTVS